MGLSIDLDAVVEADRTERRQPTDAPAHVRAETARRDVRPRSVDVADVEEPGQPEPERQRDVIFGVAQDFSGAAHREPGGVDRGHLAELPAAQAVGTAQEEALEDRDRFVGPPELVAALEPSGQDVAEPDRLEVRRGGHRLDEFGVAAEPREVDGDSDLPTPRRRLVVVAAVAGDRGADHRSDPSSLLVEQLG